jgi:hypothetical protein
VKEKIKFESGLYTTTGTEILIEGTRDQLLLLQKALNKVVSAPRPIEAGVSFVVVSDNPMDKVSAKIRMVEGE